VDRSFACAGTPCLKSLFCTDGKRPDGLTLVPWQSGKSLCWDVTSLTSGDEREGSFLFQRVSVLVQGYNAVLLHDTLPVTVKMMMMTKTLESDEKPSNMSCDVSVHAVMRFDIF